MGKSDAEVVIELTLCTFAKNLCVLRGKNFLTAFRLCRLACQKRNTKEKDFAKNTSISTQNKKQNKPDYINNSIPKAVSN